MEVYVRFDKSVQGKTVFLLRQANMPRTNLFQLFFAVDAARRTSAKEVIYIVPYTYLTADMNEEKRSRANSI
ncbi:MAG: ribose-phosphate pyrophosphokinase-like domain-containing protein [Bacteroidota bacterium]